MRKAIKHRRAYQLNKYNTGKSVRQPITVVFFIG
ncbi:hypothetical protein BE28_0066 [Staphylococcus phage vB_SepS_BE28]|nr:hypothetical protein BE28_0066 [Staphylococcus phage vB_SepS_BE28]DAU94776.1 MAG TPA: hypothetical protein [Caudoviricetes sp.]